MKVQPVKKLPAGFKNGRLDTRCQASVLALFFILLFLPAALAYENPIEVQKHNYETYLKKEGGGNAGNPLLVIGSKALNNLGGSILSDLGRARSNFALNSEGKPQGDLDLVYALDTGGSSFNFVQMGARSMHDDRWVGNFALGRRFFDKSDRAIGINAVIDYDLTRQHSRASVGGELWLDWARLASNIYFPLSSGKYSTDLANYRKEKVASGWDAMATLFVPWYRNLALKGSISQWYGNKTRAYGSSTLESNPTIWGYEIEYTPVPLFSAYMTQKGTEKGHSTMEFGLRFSYNFNMPFEDSLKHSKVASTRSVQHSRDAFVDRENKMFLNY